MLSGIFLNKTTLQVMRPDAKNRSLKTSLKLDLLIPCLSNTGGGKHNQQGLPIAAVIACYFRWSILASYRTSIPLTRKQAGRENNT